MHQAKEETGKQVFLNNNQVPDGFLWLWSITSCTKAIIDLWRQVAKYKIFPCVLNKHYQTQQILTAFTGSNQFTWMWHNPQ